jgi:hypothetical protein
MHAGAALRRMCVEAWVRRWLALGERREFIVGAVVYFTTTFGETEMVFRVDIVSQESERKNCKSSYSPRRIGVYLLHQVGDMQVLAPRLISAI